MNKQYLPQNFEKKWIEKWEKDSIYKIRNPKSEIRNSKMYVLDMFPYPSGAGLHVGHPRGYVASDIIARYYRMNNHSVLHPMGWDAFGLPAENAAIKAKKNPMDMVPANIATFKRQMQMLGLSYDWDRELNTTDPNYYKWTQWLFIQFYKAGLLYKKNVPINFCPSCKTGCSEEEVLSNGTHERCGNKIEKKELPQWLFKITMYADRLLADLHGLDWPKGILEMQKNWIGRKEGINIDYKVKDTDEIITCFTTRPDTNFGATFIVLAPEHPFVNKILNSKSEILNKSEIKKYVEQAKAKTEMEREAEGRKKTGVFTGYYAVNNLNGKLMPIWISDFVLMGFGTGAVVGVPGHDVRDFEFAKEFDLEIIRVVIGQDGDKSPVTKKEQVYEDEGTMINSDFLNGMDIHDATQKIMDYLEEKGWGKRVVTYHLRDWIFSRQRYWGEPIPMVYCKKDNWQPVPEDQLPIKLPYVKSYEPTNTGESPLSNIKDWVNTVCPKCGEPARRETDTMPNWAGSSWYFLAFPFWNQEEENPKLQTLNSKQNQNSKNQNSKSLENLNLENSNLFRIWNLDFRASIDHWLPVDWYLGGAEHAVLHLLYSRFWVKALYDLKLLNFTEPFLRLRNQGMILAEDHRKMSKSFGNVVNPDEVVAEYGADSIRLYEMFMAPFNTEISWSTTALQGVYRFLKRVWGIYNSESRIQNSEQEEDKNLVAKLNKTIAKVTQDITDVKFNTAIAAMMEFLNEWEQSSLSKDNAKKFLKIIAPFAPFITEEIWHEVFEEKESIHLSNWPAVGEEKIIEAEITIPVQVNGKLRATVSIQNSESRIQNNVVEKALMEEKLRKYLEGKEYKIIYVPGKILNFVIKPA